MNYDIEPIPYDPRSPFDIDVSPIPGDTLKGWRKSQRSERGRAPHPSQQEAALQFGIGQRTYGRWESESVPKWHAALFREWLMVAGEIDIPRRRATKNEVATLCICFGGYRRVADALDAGPRTIREWLGAGSLERDGAPKRSAAGPLIAWLVQDMRLDVVNEFSRPDVGLKRGY